MAYLLAKNVRSIEYPFYELLYDAPGTKEDKQDFFQRRRKVLVPKTNYEVMWERLVEWLGRAGAGEALFDYVLYAAGPRLQGLLVEASRGRRVKLRQNEKAAVSHIFWLNGKLRRIGEHLVGYMVEIGKTPTTKKAKAGKKRTKILPPTTPERSFQYDVALSCAGEQRSYVKPVYKTLKKMGIKTFYDEAETVSLWGKDLEVHLDKVFRKMARVCVVFVSKEYVSKSWPSFEAQSALARSVEEKGEYVLPVRFDDSELPGLRPTLGYLDANRYTPEQLAQIIKSKMEELE